MISQADSTSFATYEYKKKKKENSEKTQICIVLSQKAHTSLLTYLTVQTWPGTEMVQGYVQTYILLGKLSSANELFCTPYSNDLHLENDLRQDFGHCQKILFQAVTRHGAGIATNQSGETVSSEETAGILTGRQRELFCASWSVNKCHQDVLKSYSLRFPGKELRNPMITERFMGRLYPTHTASEAEL